MNPRRVWTMFVSRNREFFRDRAAFGWNFVFPFLLVAGFSIVFGDDARRTHVIGVFPRADPRPAVTALHLPPAVANAPFVRFVGIPTREDGLDRLAKHRLDLLLPDTPSPDGYWTTEGPNARMAEEILLAAMARSSGCVLPQRRVLPDAGPRYIDWLFPGILGMNVMMSALWGVGYVIVRYRKNGALKRLRVTAITAMEYLTAQVLSRIFLLLFTLSVMWGGCDLIFHFRMLGSYLNLLLVFLLGIGSLCGLGLIVAARGVSEEFASGVVNFISWPMMFLSEVWFSLEGAPDWIIAASRWLPLTHMLTAARKIALEGAGLMDILPELGILAAMTVVFLGIAAALFSWTE